MLKQVKVTPFLALMCFGLSAFAVGAAPTAAHAHEVVVTIHEVKAIDKIDQTPADFFAKVMIDGNVESTKKVRQDNHIKPNWVVKQEVSTRRPDIKIELWDKDLALDDLVDINGRKDISKRHQDLSVDTKTCRVYGFRGSPKCGTKITRSGDEKKIAEITFSVDVK